MNHISERTAQHWIVIAASGIGTIAFSWLAVANSEPILWGFALCAVAIAVYTRWRVSRPESFFLAKEKAKAEQSRSVPRWRVVLNSLVWMAFVIWCLSYHLHSRALIPVSITVIAIIYADQIFSMVSASWHRLRRHH